MKSFIWVRIFLAFAGFAMAVAVLPQEPEADRVFTGTLTFSPDEEALYLERFEQVQKRKTAAEIYRPLEVIAGDDDWEPLPAAALGEQTISETALRNVSAFAAANNSNALIIWRDGKVEGEYYFGDQTRTMPINSFSLAKPVTVAAVGRAILLGKIRSLNQPVADFVTEWNSDPLRSKILVRHLLDMRSGFLAQIPGSHPPEHVLSRTFLHPRHDEIIVAEYPVLDEPGTRYEYNNAASEMVAVLIERATGRRYAEFVGTEIWQKIGAMGSTVWVNREGGVPHAGCCMLAPAENFLRLAILALQDGVWNGSRLLPEGYVAAMTTPTLENPYYGLGLYVAGRYTERRGWSNPDRPVPKVFHSEPYLADDLYLFDGNMNQVVYIIPSQGLVILRTGSSPPRTKDSEWDNAFLPNTIMRGIVKNKRQSAPQAR